MPLTYEEYLKTEHAQQLMDGFVRGFTAGCLVVGRQSLLRLLELRGIQVSEAANMRIQTCEDLPQLELWFTRSNDASRVEEIFD